MQDKDSEALRNQRRRRKRIGRIKSAIAFMIAGWILCSMILIVCLFAKISQLEQNINRYIENQNAGEGNMTAPGQTGGNSTETLDEASTEVPGETTYAAAPPLTGVADAWNLAEKGDVHKVYLTFDDGPSEYTGDILDILAEYGIKATFFVVGSEEEGAGDIYRRIVEEGHTLGMHSYSNKYSVIYQSREAFAEDYRKLHDYLLAETGVDVRYYRFRGGSSNQISNVPMADLIHYLNEQGVVYYDWNVTSGDAAAAFTTDEIVEKVTGDVAKYKTSVVLLHDTGGKQTTVEALGPLIEALQAMEAEILPIGDDTDAIQYVRADGAE